MREFLKPGASLRRSLLVTGAALAALAGAASAQDAGAEDEVVVTGSRIPQPNLQSVSPVTAITAEEIQNRGITRVEDLLNALPQVAPGQGAYSANAATGAANVDLRALGASRTLVLIDGRRMTAGDITSVSTAAAPDLNMIPASLVRRVEVLTGGASAVYGADAVAGVVNFIMDDNFEGFRIEAGHSFYQTDTSDDFIGDLPDNAAANPRFFRVPEDNQVDGEAYSASAIFGAGIEGDRGNVTAYVDYRNVKAVLQANRGYSACTFGESSVEPLFACAGSSTSFPAQIQPTSQAESYQRGQYVGLPGTAQQISPDDGSLIDPFSFLFNFGALNHFQRPDERYSGGAFANYRINNHVEAYSQFMFMDDRTVAQIAPSGIFAGSGLASLRGNYPINCNNPFLSDAQIELICNADSLPDAYDPLNPDQSGGGEDGDEPNGLADRDEAIAALIAGGDLPGTPLDESDPVTAAAIIDGTIGLQPTCADPNPGTEENEALCVVNLRTCNVNGGNRQADLRHTQYRFVLGARGELTPGWSYDAYGLYNTLVYQQNYLNEFSLSRINRALINVGGQCSVNVDNDPSNDDPSCVPINIFDQFGPTQQQLDYVTASGQIMGSSRTSVFSSAITGDLATLGLKSPAADDGIAIAFGVEARHEELELRPDSAFCPSDDDSVVSDLLGQGATQCSSDGAYSVVELFGEVQAPLAQNLPLLHSLGLELGYRYSDYSIKRGNKEIAGRNSFTTDTYKIGGHWAPTEDVRFRAAYQRASRAPNIIELFSPRGVGLAGTTDPCAGPDPGATPEECALTGVAPNQYGFIEANPAAQYNGLLGGTFDLTPETADTITVGFNFTPTFLDGLTLSLDWYNIQIEDRIGPIGTDIIISQCIATANPDFCSRVHRSPGSGSLWLSPDGYIFDPNTNNGSLETTGFDLDATYRFAMGSAGEMSVNYLGNYVNEYLITPSPAPTFDCVGQYGPACSGAMGGYGNPLPQYRHKVRFDWETPIEGLSLGAAWRFIDEVTLDPASQAAFESANGFTPVGELKLESQNYLDLSGSWAIWENVTVRGGVNNVTDEDPPLTGISNCPTGPCSGNTWPQLYDALGRYFFFGITADF
jgi:outer membrane receptor protein involved in Fe transport